ncbi:DUF1850 domain-containing protein [Halalkalibacillus halophilus]|uniref:DUF1850 domain-containing protein n=1 Tax=Halalkalibacillus halophilus TaxID=392827 RepID=UPI000483966B|nr:DUF1850 domain-containing protein [Halalkalibacillus halophilus]
MTKTNFVNRLEKGKALLNSNAFFHQSAMKWTLICSIIIAIILLFLYISTTRVLVISETENNDILWQEPIELGDWFEHEYIHSVEQSPVIEKFQLMENGEIHTQESWTKSFGAGLPHTAEGDVEITDGYYVMKNLDRPLRGESLQMKPSDIRLHTFSFKEETITLSEPPFVGKVITIEVQDQNWVERMINR